MNSSPLRIAMWSGPRNISTAMMRSWGNRPDTEVVDEPFYAFYLKETRAEHPAAEEVIADGETDWRKVVAHLTDWVPERKSIFFQKQMTHHLLPQIDRDWLGAVTNCFLIRDPREVIISYAKKNGEPALLDLGFVQQAEIFDWVRAHLGGVPPVIDASDLLRKPRKILGLLCDSLGVEFDSAMLFWPAGLRETDGRWAKYWYSEVANSTSFRAYESKNEDPPEKQNTICAACSEIYERLRAHRLH